jgi:sarcosine oxidase subunit gamma
MHIEEQAGFGLATVMARMGVSAARIGNALGVTPAPGAAWSGRDGSSLTGVGPGTWLLLEKSPSPCWIEELRDRLAGLASVSDQSSGYCLWRLSGVSARTLLQRGMVIDLHPDSFSAGSAAVTAIAHISVVVRQLDDLPTYEVAVFRSFATSFRHWLDQAQTGS